MDAKITDVTEEYLESIYRLQQSQGVARTSALVNMLNVAPGTITNTIKRLERDHLVTHEPYKGVKLTDTGRKMAIDVLRRHRLSERLLTDILNLDWGTAHEAACKLEHGLTENVTTHLERLLGHPKTCPHGNPIPTANGEIIEEKSEPLTQMNIHENGIIIKIEHEEPAILQYLATLNLRPQVPVEIIEKAPFRGPITLSIDGNTHAISRSIAEKIWISKQ